MANKLVIIDGNAIMHRAFHAMPPLTTPKGEPIGAVQGFINMLLTILENLHPTHLAVCFDRKEPTFRKKAFKAYQAHRPETDKGLITQFATIRKVLEAFHIKTFDKAGYEADDLIGTLSTHAKGKVDQVVVVTGDKDQFQLINDYVSVYLPVRGLSQAKLMGPRDVYGKLGVYPEQVVDLKALMGDPSDNYKGIPGIGPKTAERLLAKYKTYKAIYAHLADIDKRIAEKLHAGKKSGDMSYDLAQIDTHVHFEYNFADMREWQLDSDEALAVFNELGFRTLRRRIFKRTQPLVVQNETIVKSDQGKLF